MADVPEAPPADPVDDPHREWDDSRGSLNPGQPWAVPATLHIAKRQGTFITKDSGVRKEFATGSQRDSQEGKGRYDLLPPEAIRRYAQLLQRGAEKYGDRNWELGQDFSRVISSMLRHAFQAAAGETDEDHLAAVIFNAAALITFEERIARGELDPEIDDRPSRQRDRVDPLSLLR